MATTKCSTLCRTMAIHRSIHWLKSWRSQFIFLLKKTISCSISNALFYCAYLCNEKPFYFRSSFLRSVWVIFVRFWRLSPCFVASRRVVYIVLLGLLRKSLVQNSVRSKTKSESVRKPFIVYDFFYISLAFLITQELITLATSCV